MPLVVWGVDEVLEAIGAIYVIVIGLVFLLVRLERDLYADPSQSAKPGRSGRKTSRSDNHPNTS
jgi:hypothetical protein